jgi:hypothetical protein
MKKPYQITVLLSRITSCLETELNVGALTLWGFVSGFGNVPYSFELQDPV